MTSLLAIDPGLVGRITWGVIIMVVAKVLVAFVIGLVSTMLMVWFERKVVSGMQNRVGPNKAGPWGLFQTLADGIKLFFKEDLVPERADRFVFKLAPYMAFVPAFLIWCVIPLGGDFTGNKGGVIEVGGIRTLAQVADPPVGILLVLMLSAIAVYGVMLAGWASGSKYPLLGSVRASAQMVSYEAALGLSLSAVLLISGTLSTNGIVNSQRGSLVNWHIVATGFVPFIVFLVAATAEMNRPPFDLVEAEQELVGGFNTEYSSIRFALFFLAEFMNTVTMSAVIVTLFLGGPHPVAIGDTVLNIPLIPGGIEGSIWFLLKLLLFLYAFVWFRGTLPRLRYDQLMDLGWKILIPLALGWFMLLAGLRVARDEGWNRWVVGAVGVVVLGVCWTLLQAAHRAASRTRAKEGAMF